MPIHDWTRVEAGTWHDMHLAWISEIRTVLNSGLLPQGYYALAEQVLGPMGPDVLTLREPPEPILTPTFDAESGGIALATRLPRTRHNDELPYLSKQRRIAIRHASDDHVIALIELVSPGNKSSVSAVQAFVRKAVQAIRAGYHLLVVDLFPATGLAPDGLHGAIWQAFGGIVEDEDIEPLRLMAYCAGDMLRSYVEPTAVGRELLEMPLFLTAERYIDVPLEATYMAAYRGVPQRWKRVLEAT